MGIRRCREREKPGGRLEEAVAGGVDRRFPAGGDVKLGEDGGDVFGGGAGADEERLGNLAVGLADH